MKNFQDLKLALNELKLPDFRIKQIIFGICHKNIGDIDLLSTLPQNLRMIISDSISIYSIKELISENSADGNVTKTLFETIDKKKIEAVLMNYNDGRHSLCISSQSGCQMGCKFCATGKLGLLKNLTYEEIFDQALFFNNQLAKKQQEISNIVFMGMGEPFMNYDEVIKAADMLSSPDYLGIGARKITLSTSGVIPGILKLADEPKQYNLAVSLHAPNQELREKIMPIAKKWHLTELMDSIQTYISKTNRRVSYEYVMLNGINDSEEIAEQLAELIEGQLCHVNLIPFNPTDSLFQVSQHNQIEKFKNILLKRGVNATIRITMGQDIAAACGQLANKKH